MYNEDYYGSSDYIYDNEQLYSRYNDYDYDPAEYDLTSYREMTGYDEDYDMQKYHS